MKTGLMTAAAAAFMVVLFAGHQGQFSRQMALLSQKLERSEEDLGRARQELTGLYSTSHFLQSSLSHAERELSSIIQSQGTIRNILEQSLFSRLAPIEKQLERSEAEVAGVKRALSRDISSLYENVLYPSVQVNGKGGVGGGTLIYSRETPDGAHATYILSAFHVIKKILSKRGGRDERDPVEVKLYGKDGAHRQTLLADLVSHDDKKDIALLKLRSERPFTNLAKLASREVLKTIQVFTPIYAVGCPLGHDPLPTIGEVSTLHKEVGGERFWMMNAPTIFGNSGGGIFNRETHELIGISAMICTYDNFIATPVPHMGILVSLDTIYDWLDSRNLQFVYTPASSKDLAGTSTPQPAASEKVEAVRTTW